LASSENTLAANARPVRSGGRNTFVLSDLPQQWVRFFECPAATRAARIFILGGASRFQPALMQVLFCKIPQSRVGFVWYGRAGFVRCDRVGFVQHDHGRFVLDGCVGFVRRRSHVVYFLWFWLPARHPGPPYAARMSHLARPSSLINLFRGAGGEKKRVR
jgi:hypothetical protein